MEVIPAIDLLGSEAVRLEQGDYARVSQYGEPDALARRFAAEGARWIHVVDLDGARGDLIRPVVFSALVHASRPASVQASGGIRSVADAETLVRAGASRVVAATARWAAPATPRPPASGARAAGRRKASRSTRRSTAASWPAPLGSCARRSSATGPSRDRT